MIYKSNNQSAEVICDSIGPNGKRITTLRIHHNRFIHAELLRHRLFSFSVASSRAIPYPTQRKQVEEDPVIPIMYQKHHKGMQGIEIFPEEDGNFESMTRPDLDVKWLHARNNALEMADSMEGDGVSKQILNRLIEPWVSTRCIVTATEWDNFFVLRHPRYYARVTTCENGHKVETAEDVEPTQCSVCNTKLINTEDEIVWDKEPNLHFPAEVHIQELAILMKQAMDNSTPTVLKAGEWHLPFVSEDEKVLAVCGLPEPEMTEAIKLHESKLVKLSAARCAFTSYDKNAGKSLEQELATAASLIKDHHWSPFEHQAQAIYNPFFEFGTYNNGRGKSGELEAMPKGIELRINHDGSHSFWSRNFCGAIQARALLDE